MAITMIIIIYNQLQWHYNDLQSITIQLPPITMAITMITMIYNQFQSNYNQLQCRLQ